MLLLFPGKYTSRKNSFLKFIEKKKSANLLQLHFFPSSLY